MYQAGPFRSWLEQIGHIKAVKRNPNVDVCWVKLIKTQSHSCPLHFETPSSSVCSVQGCMHKQEELHLNHTEKMLDTMSKLVSRLPLQSMGKNSYLWRAGSPAFLGNVLYRLPGDLIGTWEQKKWAVYVFEHFNNKCRNLEITIHANAFLVHCLTVIRVYWIEKIYIFLVVCFLFILYDKMRPLAKFGSIWF